MLAETQERGVVGAVRAGGRQMGEAHPQVLRRMLRVAVAKVATGRTGEAACDDVWSYFSGQQREHTNCRHDKDRNPMQVHYDGAGRQRAPHGRRSSKRPPSERKEIRL
jgi:hypothetical protein